MFVVNKNIIGINFIYCKCKDIFFNRVYYKLILFLMKVIDIVWEEEMLNI